MTQALIPAALFVGTLTLYVATRSISLDDFDSFNFARAIDVFDVRANQPQPPGYALYVFLARLMDLLVHEHQLALTLLSAVCGTVCVLALWGVGSRFGAPVAALPLAVMPLFWLSSGMALSDVPGLAFASAAVWLLARGSFVAGLTLAGLTMGVRPQDAIVPLAVALFWALPRGAPRETALKGLLAFFAACLIWLVPLVISLGGPGPAWAIMAGQGRYVGATDSLLARPLTGPNVEARLAEFGDVFSAYFGGPAAGGVPALAGLAAAIGLLSALAPKTRWPALSWLLPYAIFMLLFMRPDDPRKVLPAVPPMLLLLAGIRPKALAAGGCVALTGWFGFAAAPLVSTLDLVKAPPEQAAEYVAAEFQPVDTLIVAGSSYNAVRYRDPAFTTYLLDELDSAALERDVSSGKYRNLVLLDKEGFSPPENFVGVASRTFRRDPLVLPKASTVWMAVYRPLSELRDRDLALPDGPVHLGMPEDVRYVLEGWHRPETVAGVPARWAERQSRLRFWVERARPARMELVGVAYPAGQRLTVRVNGQVAGSLDMVQDWAPYNISLPPALFHPEAINTISLEHSSAVSAFEATQGQSLDRRPLAAAYSSFELRWE
jgi:hypothetical protein